MSATGKRAGHAVGEHANGEPAMTEYPTVKVEHVKVAQDTRLLRDDDLDAVTGGSAFLSSAFSQTLKAIGDALNTVARA
jgi:hypothetical protein